MSLVDVPWRVMSGPMARIWDPGDRPARLSAGVYLSKHWNFEFETSAELGTCAESERFPSYGVCDSPEAFLAKYPEIGTSARPFVVNFVCIRKAEQPRTGGWRWHKWGPYVGAQSPQYEYLYDEPHIEQIYTFHVYEVRS